MVAGIHTDLIVAIEGVHEAEEFMTGRGVHYEVHPRLREAIFWVGPVDICEIDAKPPLRVFHLSDGLCLEELTDLFINRLLSF